MMARKTQTGTPFCLFVLLLTLIISKAALAQNNAFTYQGKLTDAGNPANGAYDLQFRLFDALVSGNPVGTPRVREDVSVAGGIFTVTLDFDAVDFPGANRWLEISVRPGVSTGTFTALNPRQPITATPYAIQSLNAATATNATNATQLNGQGPSFYQNASNLNAGTIPEARLSNNVAVLNTAQTFSAGKTFSAAPSFTAAGSPFSVTSTTRVTNLNADQLDGLDSTAFLQSVPVPLTLGGTSATHIIRAENAATDFDATAVYGLASAPTGITYGGRFDNSSSSGYGVIGLATAINGATYGVYGRSTSGNGYGVSGDATGFLGVGGFFTSLNHNGLEGWSRRASGSASGVYGLSVSTSGYGVQGYANATSGSTVGVYGESESTSGIGVSGLARPTGGNTIGVYGQSDSQTGKGVSGLTTAGIGASVGVYGQSESTSGIGVSGLARPTIGNTIGVYGQSNSQGGTGVSGLTTAAVGFTVGVSGVSYSNSGTGVYGRTLAATGINIGVHGESSGDLGYGVFGRALSVNGAGFGVAGENANPTKWAIYAYGNMGASGVKPFRIDHPDDPENKYLLHYAAESPEVINFYSGKVTLDSAGEAVVELPPYFAKINKDPRYTLTAVGAPMPMLHVAQEINEASLSTGATAGQGEVAPLCWFRVAGGLPGAKVSWRVEALRNDKWLQKSGAPVEVEKQGLEKGTYQHPELYGQPPEKSVTYNTTRERPASAQRP